MFMTKAEMKSCTDRTSSEYGLVAQEDPIHYTFNIDHNTDSRGSFIKLKDELDGNVAEPPELIRLKCANHHHKGHMSQHALQTE